eukprot:CAMPEP_0201617222 /NCGR_PEP_ID=MMETSP0492-20130828/35795_1 /ASSEMBLY_ACC=CAM_ASM_000837 /TAXON_ID=420259 /ORGANISM="Thalassiosira gravida, Strain GMp14c1" /LENGTH=246 /DNA_ID=CAMNT_0048085409 /DNA_START=93 /DNA_END=833 /DNA_ORIENTATION=-
MTSAPMLASTASTAIAMALILALCSVVAPPANNAVVVVVVAFVPASRNDDNIRRFGLDTTNAVPYYYYDASYLSMRADGNRNDDEYDSLEDDDPSVDDNDDNHVNNDATTNSSNSNEENKNKTENKNKNKNNNMKDDEDDDGLSWRIAKLRLEEANTLRLLKRKPLKLPYAASREWIQRNWAIRTKEEFDDLVECGNLRTPYISKRPEEYYGRRGEWISWDHYLLGDGRSDGAGGAGRNGTDLKWA